MSMKVVLLAAGISSRMGERNKLLLPFRDSTLFEEALKTALSYTDDIIVVTGYERERLLPAIRRYGVQEAYNAEYERGQESSIDRALSTLSEDILICPCDLSLLTREHYIRAENALKDHLSARPVHEGTPGHPVALSKAMVLKARKRSVPLRTLLKENNIYLYSEDRASVCDVDTPEAYRALITGQL